MTDTEQYKAYDRIRTRLVAAERRLARATDAKATELAQRAVTRITAERDAFLAPITGEKFAPARIVAKFASAWGRSGMHRFECEMELTLKDLSGPQYRLVRVVSESGAPPTGARSAPTVCGYSWDFLADVIARGDIQVLA